MLCLLLSLLLSAGAALGPLPQWKEGEMFIHAINSARGECTFIILPDGTTVVVDAGRTVDTPKYASVAPKPDAFTDPGEVYARYIRHFLPAVSRDSIDCFVLTHYHGDHMDAIGTMYSMMPFRRILDRSYPDYSANVRTGGTTRDLSPYCGFVVEHVSKGAFAAERFKVGSDTQLHPEHGRVRKFSIMNYAGGGYAWNGAEVVDCHPSRENAMSCAFLISYGPFEYWTSGDCNDGKVIRTVTEAIGHRVEASKCLHHMSNPGEILLENRVLRPQVVVTQSFFIRDNQPHRDVIGAIGAEQDLFFTNIDSSLVDAAPEVYSGCRAIGGHIVIRVLRGGRKFYVYQLDDTAPDYRVKAVYGPYKSHYDR